jgi:hypothetical protein
MRPIQVRFAETEKEKAAKKQGMAGGMYGGFPPAMMNPMAAMQILQMQAMQQQQQPQYGGYGVWSC